MSIFKSTFTDAVKKQLTARQKAMVNRTPQNLQYLNSRNAWIRMVSSVDVNDDKGALARKYVLQGGTLNENKNSKIGTAFTGSLKSGIGSDFSNAYSNVSANKNANGKYIPYRLGIRPMPGITSVEIKSLSAYGSLREATVNFQCWDIQQLEDLEVLYMRPGYTVLLEWGWTPYLDNNGKYQSNFTDYYDILNQNNVDRTTLFRELFDKSVKYGGNYDAMFGYVKNYQWSARMDGGYDCQTNIITTGEIIESLKINYISSMDIKQQKSDIVVPYAAPTPPTPTSFATFGSPQSAFQPTPTFNTPIQNVGLLKEEFTNSGNTITEWEGAYQTNVLAGIWAELYYKSFDPAVRATAQFNSPNSALYNEDIQAFTSLPLFSPESNKNSLSAKSSKQIYITLGGVINILNKYIIAKSKNDGQPLVRLSLQSNEYDGSPVTDLYCTAHPLQVSVDPGVCLIKSPLWTGGDIINVATASVAGNTSLADAQKAVDLIIKEDTPNLTSGINLITSKEIYLSVEELLKTKGKGTLQTILNNNRPNIYKIQEIQSQLNSSGIKLTFTPSTITNSDGTQYQIVKENSIEIEQPSAATSSTATSQAIISTRSKQAIADLQFLKALKADYFYQGRPELEIGIIKNIYINVDYLFQSAIDRGLEAGDSKGKNEISLLSYLKKIISDIQSAIGNVSNFEIHVDPVDNNVARIIDVNYTEPEKAVYDKLFELQVHNLESIVRSYTLQSQIFPNQGAVIAIGSQAKGGQLGMQTNTFIDFNRSLVDRIIPEKVDGMQSPPPTSQNNTPTITNGIAQIINAFSYLNVSTSTSSDSTSPKTDLTSLVSQAKNSLRDVIVYFQSFTNSPGSNRNLIPTKFSCVIDGIGGLVIGHMFRLPKDVMPKGYRGEGIGSELGNAITSIGHTISNSDWSTQIDTLNIVLDSPNPEGIDFGSLDLTAIKNIISTAISTGIPLANIPSTSGGNANWMKQAGNAVFTVNKGVDSYCARYTYAIARGYTMLSRKNSPDGKLGLNGTGTGVGNANDEIYRKNLIALGYKMYPLGTLTKQQLIDKINGTWGIGDIINYRSLTPIPNSPHSSTYGHTQIYTGNSLDIGGRGGGGSNNIPWASSWANNYGLSFVYNRSISDSWEVYIFKLL